MPTPSLLTSFPTLELPHKPQYIKLELSQVSFFELFLRIEKDCSVCFLLESLEISHPDSRYDAIGFTPQKLLHATPSALIIEELKTKEISTITSNNPYQEIAKWLPQNILSRNYAGGLVGYVGYDASNLFEKALRLKYHPYFAPLYFGLYTDGLLYDKLTGSVTYFYYLENRIDLVNEWLKSKAKQPSPLKVISKGASCSKKEHATMVTVAMEEIKAGNSFQCQLGFQEDYEVSGDLLHFYQRLRQINPSPHMYYMKFNTQHLIGSSPELVFRLRQGEIETFPLAGTIGRGNNLEEDTQLARKLLSDPKEIAEHNMLVDLHRNDLGRIARFGSVHVRHLMDIKKFSHVQHISSEVAGMIRKDYDMFSGLAAVFPAGTLSGAPKIETMKIIERLEQSPRGPYGGAIGHFGFNGDCTFAIPIRTLFVHESTAFARASSGIVYDSVIEQEYAEIHRKLGAIQVALK